MAENENGPNCVESLVRRYVNGDVRAPESDAQVREFVKRMELATREAYKADKRAQRESLEKARHRRLD